MNKQTYSYDSACERLAEYFLGQPRNPDEVQELAQHVQDAVEAFFVGKNGGDPICRICATQETGSAPLSKTCICGDYQRAQVQS